MDNKVSEQCNYCHEDKDGCVRPLDKNGHFFLYPISAFLETKLQINWHGYRKELSINYCPMCGRKLRKE